MEHQLKIRVEKHTDGYVAYPLGGARSLEDHTDRWEELVWQLTRWFHMKNG